MSKYKFLKNHKIRDKKAQVGETVSWIVATVIVLGIMIFFIYVSILISKTKMIQTLNLQSDVADKPELLMYKTSLSHQLAGNLNKEIIDNILKEENG
ncbi:MAG: hypothetical protein PHQ66_00725 [Candidatus Nanoarchaeia archaeon]|nr:hypothetical protein [Candidatus Nanoarchaeia archaeon]MDD5358498.1 hypothetical protein [Candidatus Nanoarchaeia archaeon]MDD5589012.1 hypothetical protein [Candidatus Nanoarchaeia archaeon]